MKTIIRLATVIILATMAPRGMAQTFSLCPGTTTVITAINSASLSSPSYSLNPGGITSPNPTFAITPTNSITYTLYVTGTNSSSAVVTTTNTVAVIATGGVTYSVVSPQNFTLGCATNSVATINIINASTTNSNQVPTGGPVSYTILAPGSLTNISTAVLSSFSNYTAAVPGTWSVVVRNNASLCSNWTTVNITLNNAPPVISSVSVSQNTLSCTTPSALVQAAFTNTNTLCNWLPGNVSGNSLVVTSNTAAPTQSIAVTLTLVASDANNGCQSTSVVPIYQNVFPPNAAINAPTGTCQNTVVLTNISSSGIPSSIFPVSGPVVALLWEGPSPQTTLGLSTTYTAQTSGVYTMTARDNNNGCIKTATINVAIGANAAFVHTVTSGTAVFNDASTGTNSNTTYYWDFGDGNTSTAQNPTHSYISGGAFAVKLRVKDNVTLCKDSVIQSITVSGIPCTANSNFSMVPTTTAQLWNVIPAYPWNISAVSWSWGDASYSNTLYTSHQYSAAGMYNICLSVTVSCVASSSTCTSYSVYRASQSAMVLKVNVVAPELISGLANAGVNEQLVWNIVPNPNAGEFNIKLDNAKSDAIDVIICDLTGRIVHKQLIEAGSGSLSLNTGHLPSGMYFVSLGSGNQRLTKRMFVNR